MKFLGSILVFIIYQLYKIGVVEYQPVLIFNLILVLSVGLLHGSNDLLIYKRVTGTKWKYLVINYLIVGLVFLLSYFIAPILCLLLFVVVSAYHFGQELYESEHFKSSLVENLTLGLLIFLMMFAFNAVEFNRVFEDLTSFQLSEIWLIYLTIASGVLFIVSLVIGLSRSRISFKTALSHVIGLAFLALLFYGLDLFTSFIVFFVFWHSLPSLNSQMLYLYKENKTWLKYVKDAAPIYLISLVGIVLGYFIFFDQDYFNQFALFVGILVTVPHIIIIHKLYGGANKRLKSKTP